MTSAGSGQDGASTGPPSAVDAPPSDSAPSAAASPSAAPQEALRLDRIAPVFIAVAFGTSALFAAVSLTPILAVALGGSTVWTGVPAAAAVFGTGVGSLLVARLTVGLGRKAGLTIGWLLGALGAGLGTAGVLLGSIWVLVGGMLVFGVGHASNGLSRYAAAELVPASARGRAIGIVVWASVIGGVAGPAIIALVASGRAAHATAGGVVLPVSAYLGLVAAGLCYVAAAIVLSIFHRSAPSAGADAAPVDATPAGASPAAPAPASALSTGGEAAGAAPPRRTLGDLMHIPRVRLALVALAVSQVIMVLVMTVTPVHISADGSHLQTVTLVMGGHFVGMYILAPLVGVFVDRFGVSPVITSGMAILFLAALAAALASSASPVYLAPALFFIGIGWSLCFVAASGALSRGLSWVESVRVQGGVDAVVWSMSATASLLSGLLLAVSGYAALAVAAALLAPVPAIWLHLRRSRLIEK